MYNEVIKLVRETKTINEYGDQVVDREEREVFAQLKSVGQSEFYQAQAVGLKPELKFVIADYFDYDNEKIVRYAQLGGEEEDYTILRTYRTGNALELVVKRGVD